MSARAKSPKINKKTGKPVKPRVGVSKSIQISKGDANRYAGNQYKKPGLRQNGLAKVDPTRARDLTHHGRKGQDLKKPRVIYTRMDGPTCGDDNYEPYINPKTGSMRCAPTATAKAKNMAAGKEKRATKRAASPKRPSTKGATKTVREAKIADIVMATSEKYKTDQGVIRNSINIARETLLREPKGPINDDDVTSIYERYFFVNSGKMNRLDALILAVKAGLNKATKGTGKKTGPRKPKVKKE